MIDCIKISSQAPLASVSARNIGVIFDSYMNFECQLVSSVCKAKHRSFTFVMYLALESI